MVEKDYGEAVCISSAAKKFIEMINNKVAEANGLQRY